MINADTNALKMADKCNEEVAPDAKKTGEEDTLDVEKIQQVVAYGKEVALDAGRAGEEDTLDVEKDSNALKRVHGERSEGTTGQQRTVYTMATGQNMTTGQQVRVKSMIDSGNTLRYGVAITDEFRRKLGLRYDSMRSKTVGTADKTGKMTQLGISEKFTLKIDGIGGYWSGKASVVKGLSDEVNIGTAALIRMGEARGKTVYLAFTPKGTRLGWMNPKEDNRCSDSEEKMLIKTIKEMQEENKSKAEADNGKAEAGTDTWPPGGQKPEEPKT